MGRIPRINLHTGLAEAKIFVAKRSIAIMDSLRLARNYPVHNSW
jgi:hypothetical protein